MFKDDVVKNAIKEANRIEQSNRKKGFDAWVKALEVLNNNVVKDSEQHQKLSKFIIGRMTEYVRDNAEIDEPEIPKAKL